MGKADANPIVFETVGTKRWVLGSCYVSVPKYWRKLFALTRRLDTGEAVISQVSNGNTGLIYAKLPISWIDEEEQKGIKIPLVVQRIKDGYTDLTKQIFIDYQREQGIESVRNIPKPVIRESEIATKSSYSNPNNWKDGKYIGKMANIKKPR